MRPLTKIIVSTVNCFVITIACSQLLPADEPDDLLENILQCRFQYTNFEATIIAEQLLGQLGEMPTKMQYHLKVDEKGGRSWLLRKPLVKVEIPENDPQLLGRRIPWIESFSMRRDQRWSLATNGELLLSNRPIVSAHTSFTLFTLGIEYLPEVDWTNGSIDQSRGMFGLNLDDYSYSFLSESRIENNVKLDGIKCTDSNGNTRIAWIDQNLMRLHQLIVPHPFFPYLLKENETGSTVISSTFAEGNDSSIPDVVMIEEAINGVETHKIRLDLVKFENDKEFTDHDFLYTNMGLRINSFVRDLDSGQVLGYWNGRDWSSKKPITGGKIVSAAIEASSHPPQATPLLKIVAFTSTLIAGVLLSVWLWRRFSKPN